MSSKQAHRSQGRAMKGTIKIRSQWCKGCSLCISACPKGAIRLSSHLNEHSYFPAEFVKEADCTGCGLCAIMCPEVIIEVYREK